MQDAERYGSYIVSSEPFEGFLEHRLHQPFSAPRLVEIALTYITAERRDAALVTAIQAHPKVPDQVSIAMLSYPDCVMFTIQDGAQPIGRIANFIPIVMCAIIEVFLVRRKRSNQARQLGNIAFARGSNLDF